MEPLSSSSIPMDIQYLSPLLGQPVALLTPPEQLQHYKATQALATQVQLLYQLAMLQLSMQPQALPPPRMSQIIEYIQTLHCITSLQMFLPSSELPLSTSQWQILDYLTTLQIGTQLQILHQIIQLQMEDRYSLLDKKTLQQLETQLNIIDCIFTFQCISFSLTLPQKIQRQNILLNNTLLQCYTQTLLTPLLNLEPLQGELSPTYRSSTLLKTEPQHPPKNRRYRSYYPKRKQARETVTCHLLNTQA